MKKPGLLCAGNFIVDRIRMVESWPQQDMLTSITSETVANGGGPFNILKDLVALGAAFTLEAAGCVGDDEDGRWIIDNCQKSGITTRQIHAIANEPTSYTEVMCATATGRRTFFHRRGANAQFDVDHVDFALTQAGHFHLAYLMLLDALDTEDAAGRSRASLLLEKAKNAGLVTSVDVVSTESPRFVQNVKSALPFTDYLFINELEAERATGVSITDWNSVSISAARTAAMALLRCGVQRQVILHFSAGAIVCDVSGEVHTQGSLQLPPDWIVGSSGAGDAFAAGYLYGLHERWSTTECLRLASCAAAACLTDASPSGGLYPANECLTLNQRFPVRQL